MEQTLDIIISTVYATLDWGAYLTKLRPQGAFTIQKKASDPFALYHPYHLYPLCHHYRAFNNKNDPCVQRLKKQESSCLWGSP